MRNFGLAAMMLAATACNQSPPAEGIDRGNPLEITARERGLVREDAVALTGVFERRHNLGRDSLCVVPDGTNAWRFALSASFGPGLSCRTTGKIRADGDGWRFDFAGIDGCAPLLHEEGDELRFPGSLSDACNALCPGRASLAGIRLPRASWNEGDARRLQFTDVRGKSVTPCA